MVRKEALLEKIMNRIPGFKGYRQREALREDDRLVREYLVRLLEEGIRSLSDALAYLAEYDFSTAERFENLMRDLRLLTDKIRWSEHGYAPHYNIYKIEQEDLTKILEIDSSLIDDVERLKNLLEEIKNDALMGNPVRDKIPEILRMINTIRQELMEREKIVHGWIEAGKKPSS